MVEGHRRRPHPADGLARTRHFLSAGIRLRRWRQRLRAARRERNLRFYKGLGSYTARHEGREKALRQIVRLPDERLRLAAHGGHAGAARAMSRPRAPTTPISSSSTPATSARRRPRRSIPSSAACARMKEAAAADGPRRHHRGRRLRRAGRRRGDHPPRAGGRSRGRAAELSPPAGSAGARGARRQARRHRISGRRQIRSSRCAERAPRCARAASPLSSPCRKAATSSAPSASCPIRAARKSRGRSSKIVAEVERLAGAGVREVTLIGQNVNAYHGEGPDGRAVAAGAAA